MKKHVKKMAALALCLLAPLFCAAEEEKPLLIQWGQTTPDTRLLRKHVAYWEEYLPFDGIVIPVNFERYAGRYGHTCANILPTSEWPIIWTALSGNASEMSDYEHATEDLKATPFRRFTHNYIPLYLFSPPGYCFDWFDEGQWKTALANVTILAAIAKEGGCAGIWFDVEQYGGAGYFSWTRLTEVFPKRPQDFAAWRARVRRCGRELMQAMTSVFPGIDFPMSFGSCIVHEDVLNYEPARGKHFSHARYALLAALIDGMIEAADERTTITDVYELSYYYTTQEEFDRAGPIVRDACQAYSEIPEDYAKKIRVGLGIYPTHHGMFNRDDFTNNKFTPDGLRDAVRMAMTTSDRITWIWNESASFWIRDGPGGAPLLADQPCVDPENADPAYLTAKPTRDNVMQKRYFGVPAAYIDAITEGKARALSEVEVAREKSQ